MLEAYLDQGNVGDVVLPEWLECTNVTDNSDYSMYKLAIKATS